MKGLQLFMILIILSTVISLGVVFYLKPLKSGNVENYDLDTTSTDKETHSKIDKFVNRCHL
jgi:hypothetical protein